MGLLISSVDVGGEGKFLKFSRADSDLLLHNLNYLALASHVLYAELFVLAIYIKDLFDPTMAGAKSLFSVSHCYNQDLELVSLKCAQ